MDTVLRGIDFVFIYLDDVLVASVDEKEHLSHLETVFKLFSLNGLVLNQEKCILGVDEIQFLGHKVSAEGVKPVPEKVEAITDLPPPSTKLALQSFLGMANFYRRFLPNFADAIQPLNDAVAAATRGKVKSIVWSDACQKAFLAAKEALKSFRVLAHPSATAPTKLYTDASDIALGAELLQEQRGGEWKPIAFFSKRLAKAERNYSTFDRELLAIHEAIKYFRHHLEGRVFEVYTDHMPLTHVLSSPAERSPRQTRHLQFISEFTTSLKYVKGKENVVADALSRPDVEVNAVLSPDVDFPALAADQPSQAELQAANPSLEIEA
jgi:cleavage and polyadenylation specificity factor subunit 1